MAPSEPARAATPTLLQLSTTLLTFALACGLGLLFLLNLPVRKREAVSDEQATFKGDPLFVVQFPRFEAEPVGHSVRDVSQLPRQPIPDQLPPLNQPEQAAPAEQTPEFTAAEQMFEAFPADDYQPTELQPEFEPEPAQTVRRNTPRPATGRAGAMQPRGVISTPRMSGSRQQQTQSLEHQQPRAPRWPAQNGPYHSHPHPEPNFAAPETDRFGSESTPYAARDAELAAELRNVKEQLSRITKQLADRDQQAPGAQAPAAASAGTTADAQAEQTRPSTKIPAPKSSPAEKPVPPAPSLPTPALPEPAFDPLAEPDPQAEAPPVELAPMPEPEPNPEPEAEPNPEPKPQTEPVPGAGQPQQPMPAPIPEPMPVAPEPAVPGPQPEAAPETPQPAAAPVPPAPVPVAPPAPTVPADPSGASAEFGPPQPTEPVVRVVRQPVPAMPDERLAGMLPLPPADSRSIRSRVVPHSTPSGVTKSTADSQFRAGTKPQGGVSRAPQKTKTPPTAAPPMHGGTVARGPGKGSPPRPSGFSRSVSGIRDSLGDGREALFRPVVAAPAWLKTLFGRTKTTSQQSVAGPAVPGPAVPRSAVPRSAVPGPAGRPAVGARSEVAAVPPASMIFAEQPRGGVQRASVTTGDAPRKASIERASHSAPAAESAHPAGKLQTQYRSLRDGHNKPGSLFDPHAWAAPEWLTD